MDDTPDAPAAPGSIADERTRQALAADPGASAPTVPSTAARVVAFVAVLAAGAAGGFIGWAVTDLQCSGDCTVAVGVGGLVGAVIGAVGVAIVVQLALRAMSEWRTAQAAGTDDERPGRDRRVPPAGGTRSRPRVQ